jgi:tetratricopeptide (TPR) repeat protein
VDRFVVEAIAGEGAMGVVYRARDRQSGELVALKVSVAEVTDRQRADERFLREAAILARLAHPNIVRYVGHGVSETGIYLAMEWLEGETLEQRLERGPLSPADTVRVARQIAAGLGAAHQAGVIHRDIKPSNIVLVGGSADAVKIVDFGIARHARPSIARSGAWMVGTPGYMAPEQARGRDVDARADVFSLGCVIYRCLAGRAPFEGQDVIAVSLKLILEDVPRLASVDERIPEALDVLVARMMAKSSAARPRDGAEVDAELEGIEGADDGAPPPASVRAPALGRSERRPTTFVLAAARRVEPDAETLARCDRRFDVARDRVRELGERLDVLADGSLLVTVASTGPAMDRASRGARAALVLRGVFPEACIAVVSGRAVVADELPLSEIVERALELISAPGAPTIRLDEASADLLGARFELRDEGGPALAAEREGPDAPRTVLGRATPCVGRARELGMLEGLFEEVLTEPVARVVLVTGPPGIGKSRLVSEFLQRVRRSDGVDVWYGRGDPMRAGAPFALLAPAIRDAAGIAAGDGLDERRNKLRRRVARYLSRADAERVAEFLGEMAGAPFAAERRVQLRSARRDPLLMGDQMLRAWEDLVAAECAEHPLVLVLDDLHWGDRPTVQFVDAALRLSRDRPLLVVAIARPEVHELFPRVWSDRGERVELHLGALSKRGGERLVRAVLGPQIAQARVAALVERAGGNAFYLEELIRSVSAADEQALPDSVLATAQARLERLDAEARRVLRAAAVFGETFRASGVAALLGNSGTSRLGEWLRALDIEEVIGVRDRGSGGDDPEYAFRHALVRDAAYAMLTDADRQLGHRLAADHLESSGEGADEMSLAEHHERGGQPQRAAVWWRKAAELALEGNDLDGAVARAERCVRCGATGEVLGGALRLQAEALRWRGDRAEALRCADAAMTVLGPGTAVWYAAASEVASASGALADNARVATIADELLPLSCGEEVLPARTAALGRVAGQLFMSGDFVRAGRLVAAIEAEAPRAPDDSAVEAALHRAVALRASYRGERAHALSENLAWAESLERTGDLRWLCRARLAIGFAYGSLGAFEEAEAVLRAALEMSERLGLESTARHAHHELGMVLARLGRVDEGRAMEAQAADGYRAAGDVRMEGLCRTYLAAILLQAGDHLGAERAAAQAVTLLSHNPPYLPNAHGALASALLSKGDAEAALTAAEEAMRGLRAVGELEEGECALRLVHARALEATGRSDEARAAIAEAQRRLQELALAIGDPAWRKSWLTRVPAHAQVAAATVG